MPENFKGLTSYRWFYRLSACPASIGLQVGYWNANKMYQKEKSNDPRAKFKYNANQDLEKKDIEIIRRSYRWKIVLYFSIPYLL